MIQRIAVTAALCVAGMTASAEETLLMACTFKDGATGVSVTFDDGIVHYAYGPSKQEPDLALSEPAVDIDYTPWPGVSSSIWEAIAFTNGDFRYEVGMSFARDPESIEVNGGISISENGTEIAFLHCDTGSGYFVYDDQIEKTKHAAGLCVDHGRDPKWAPCEG
ncbi:hypothetical protein FHS72_003471 [Loktanella ponticola]|uniref:Uncharacterized protein n=1 Tax=Yoonia ponticola TaxID=1524255 RepID=A0A7W9BNT0_9RHOB|nr:hypothetical protein [Yoonia ponticola]MBB5723826.1 hypothetical protein [Yoonia ponticola]